MHLFLLHPSIPGMTQAEPNKFQFNYIGISMLVLPTSYICFYGQVKLCIALF